MLAFNSGMYSFYHLGAIDVSNHHAPLCRALWFNLTICVFLTSHIYHSGFSAGTRRSLMYLILIQCSNNSHDGLTFKAFKHPSTFYHEQPPLLIFSFPNHLSETMCQGQSVRFLWQCAHVIQTLRPQCYSR